MAKNRRKSLGGFLALHPICIFCGGTIPATTRDHVPSRQTFHMKMWPEGDEFPSCEQCNQATRHEEQVIAMLSRMLPGSITEAEKREMRAIMTAIKNNYPAVLLEMRPSREQVVGFLNKPWALDMLRSGAGGLPLSLQGPLVKACVRAFARKLFTALHYKEFGKIIPPGGGVIWRWYSNVQRLDGKMPDELIDLMTRTPTIQRTRRDLKDQFFYTYAKVVDGELTGYFAMFRKSFAMLGFIELDASRFEPEIRAHDILRPLPSPPKALPTSEKDT